MKVYLLDFGASLQPDVHLTVPGEVGIVAADDAAAWAGVENLLLPFP